MSDKQQVELQRLRSEQLKAMQVEIYGGFSKSERLEYDHRAERIHALEAAAALRTESDSAQRSQRKQWNKASETDTPQVEARQSYRSREEGSSASTASSWANRDKRKSDSDSEK